MHVIKSYRWIIYVIVWLCVFQRRKGPTKRNESVWHFAVHFVFHSCVCKKCLFHFVISSYICNWSFIIFSLVSFCVRFMKICIQILWHFHFTYHLFCFHMLVYVLAKCYFHKDNVNFFLDIPVVTFFLYTSIDYFVWKFSLGDDSQHVLRCLRCIYK